MRHFRPQTAPLHPACELQPGSDMLAPAASLDLTRTARSEQPDAVHYSDPTTAGLASTLFGRERPSLTRFFSPPRTAIASSPASIWDRPQNATQNDTH